LNPQAIRKICNLLILHSVKRARKAKKGRGLGTIWAHGCGVNPSIEIKYNKHLLSNDFPCSRLAECRFLRAMHERAWRVRTLTDTNLAKDGGRFPEIRGSPVAKAMRGRHD
jgi:hypothetical protein